MSKLFQIHYVLLLTLFFSVIERNTFAHDVELELDAYVGQYSRVYEEVLLSRLGRPFEDLPLEREKTHAFGAVSALVDSGLRIESQLPLGLKSANRNQLTSLLEEAGSYNPRLQASASILADGIRLIRDSHLLMRTKGAQLSVHVAFWPRSKASTGSPVHSYHARYGSAGRTQWYTTGSVHPRNVEGVVLNDGVKLQWQHPEIHPVAFVRERSADEDVLHRFVVRSANDASWLGTRVKRTTLANPVYFGPRSEMQQFQTRCKRIQKRACVHPQTYPRE